MKCPRCGGRVASESWSPVVTCDNCHAQWSYEAFVDEAKTLRLVWVFAPKSAYLRLCERYELKPDGTIVIDGVECTWKPMS